MDFKKGDIVYTATGQEAEYVQPVGDGHYIYVLGENGEVYDVVVSVVYDENPAYKWSEDLLKLKQERDEVLNEIKELQGFIENKKKEFENLLDDFEKNWEGLRNLRAVLDGEVKFFVFPNKNHVPVIKSWEEMAYCRSSRGTPALKAMSIFTSGEKGPEIFINEYSDGSGWWQKVIFCVDEEEAKLVALDVSIDYIRRHKAGEFDKRYDYFEILSKNFENIKELGEEVPDDLKEYVDEVLVEMKRREIEWLRKEYARKEKEIKEIEEKLREFDAIFDRKEEKVEK